jgi:pimeloyl-ACP methyl ester carboxylesterase
VLFCHGFPESWYSWRHQLEALAGQGFLAIAPDMRGYGQTERPEAIDQYSILHLTGDMVGLLVKASSTSGANRYSPATPDGRCW